MSVPATWNGAHCSAGPESPLQDSTNKPSLTCPASWWECFHVEHSPPSPPMNSAYARILMSWEEKEPWSRFMGEEIELEELSNMSRVTELSSVRTET